MPVDLAQHLCRNQIVFQITAHSDAVQSTLRAHNSSVRLRRIVYTLQAVIHQ